MTSPTIPQEVSTALAALTQQWSATEASERQLFQPWLIRFCEALQAPRPGSPPTDDDCFERPVKVIGGDSRESTNFIDYWKAGFVAVEAKASGIEASNDLLLRNAFNQLKRYIAFIGSRPPYLIVVDVPGTLVIWDGWRGEYGDFAAGKRIALGTLHQRPDDIALLRDIFANPAARDPRGKAQQVTREIATKLATLSATFEGRGIESELVARFLMRCVFCFFAEDVDLLPKDLFKRTLETARSSGDPQRVAQVLTNLWRTMDEGGMFGAELLHRFNGHFFKTVDALPLEPADVALLIEAAQFDWSRVEPSIFGTLLVRALDPIERHRLGAEYTPREYIERLVEPTVVEPIREKWTAVQASVLQRDIGKKKGRDGALKDLTEFHTWLRSLRFLDPACGSGNFLYVTMAAVKRIELEVIHEIERVIGRDQKEAILDEVHPRQFYGIEVKPWAREIAELTLWIGYHQFWREAHGGRTPPDPILEDTGTIQHCDAVLAWDDIVHIPEKDRPDPTPRVVSHVTGELVPDPSARLRYMEYVNPRIQAWPRADFVVGNPPYVGNKRMRTALGDGYVDALRRAYKNVPGSVDFVIYWWVRAAELVATGEVLRAGLITTNSITQPSHQGVVRAAAEANAHVLWAIPDHPWIGDVDSADVRVAMTVIGQSSQHGARLVQVDNSGHVRSDTRAASLNSDLSVGADVASASAAPLRATAGLSSRGFAPVGAGFLLTKTAAERLIAADRRNADVVRPFWHGKDLVNRPSDEYIIDFGEMTEAEARSFPVAFDIVRDLVKPARDAQRDPGRKKHWWRFGRTNADLRNAVRSLRRFIATAYVSRHRIFTYLNAEVAPDDKIVVIATDDPFVLGVLSSLVHTQWADAAGTRLGVGNDLTYNNPRCFDAFPFPDTSVNTRTAIGSLADTLDRHRQEAIARDERVTMTAMYNVLEKLRAGAPLNTREREVREIAACGVLRDIHTELDALVAGAYGWRWPMPSEEALSLLVKLHGERREEERRGTIRWLRPEYQVQRFGPEAVATTLEIDDVRADPERDGVRPWPVTAVEQLSAIGATLTSRPHTTDEVVAAFIGAKRDLVTRHLETLALMGEITVGDDGRYAAARKAA